tara:strand:- start:573 stop:1814 length:1242 start_codon:yes stop_codon:yes gene_type:complete
MRQLLFPKYYRDFKCIGPACEDNCCTTNYEITINKEDYQFMLYKSKLKDEAKNIFERTPDRETYARFKLDEKGHCPLITHDGWCRVYIEDGEDHLPHVCKTYPRIADPRGTTLVDMSLTLGCPEAVRKLCFDPDALTFYERKERVKGKMPKNTYKRPAYFKTIRELVRDILYISDASFEESLYTVGVALSSLSSYENSESKDVFEAIAQVRDQVAQGYPRMMFQQQASSFMHQSVFLSCCMERIEIFLVHYPDSNRRLRHLFGEFRKLLPEELRTEPLHKLSSLWLDKLSNPQALKRYHSYIKKHPQLWNNYALWQANDMDFPKSVWQVYSTRVIFLYVYFRCCLILLAQDRELTDDDFVLVVQSLHTAFHNQNMVVFMKQVQFGFDHCLDLATTTGFSLTPLILLQTMKSSV